MRVLIAILVFISSLRGTFAFENEFFLKSGLNLSINRIGVFEKDDDDDDDEKEIQGHNYFGGFGFNTHFGYRWKRFELTASSSISFGKVEKLAFVVNQNDFLGSGNYQNLMVSPNVRYFIPWSPLKSWRFAVGLGPIWSQQTIRLKDFTSSTPYAGKKFKLTYDTVGFGVGIGIEEHLPTKDMHPVYFDITYVRLYSVKSYLVDTTDSTKTNILSTAEAKKDVASEALIFSMGIVLF
ncbi:putative exported protein [Halobacteriovorax marinus SJ]|uniref:Exported protein n=1 Tax=Halobacteriovorax marinus (strain ATCC BAA-682 / DSM 15412 / SJ) TaxID=862908 RepID=E1WZ09_HALMS|nr:hypothetical protein [Halobacteriovorax marinus]CBW26106.1 putative exported protein [Halobacteriovorax marinus SJ]